MVELRCKSCGGRLSTDDEDVFVGSTAAVVVRRGFVLQCEHCGSDCAPGDDLALR